MRSRMWVGRKLWVGLVGLVAGGLFQTAAGPAAVPGSAMLLAAGGPPALQEAGGQRLRVLVGKSLVVNSPDALRRVSVTDPEVAEAIVISERQVLIHGHRTGSVTLLLWNEEEEVQAFDLEVQLDVPTLREALRRVLPKETVEVRQSGTALVLTGEVGSEATSSVRWLGGDLLPPGGQHAGCPGEPRDHSAPGALRRGESHGAERTWG
jgi:pilus assembly protein CpaC